MDERTAAKREKGPTAASVGRCAVYAMDEESARVPATDQLAADSGTIDVRNEARGVGRALNEEVINRIFAAGLAAQHLRKLTSDPELEARVDEIVDGLGDALRHLRVLFFDQHLPENQPRGSDAGAASPPAPPLHLLTHSLLSSLSGASTAIDTALRYDLSEEETRMLLHLTAQRLDSIAEQLRAVTLGHPPDLIGN